MEEEDTRDYEVLVNAEEQYSLWLAGQQIPNGWRQVGPRGTTLRGRRVLLAECLEPTLAGIGDIRSALDRYASTRAPRTSAIQLGSRENASGFYPHSGDLDTVKAAALRMTGQIDANYRKVFGHKVEDDLPPQ